MNKFFLILGCFWITACGHRENLENEVKKVISQNPQLLIDAIEKRPSDFVMAFRRAVKTSQKEISKSVEKQRLKQIDRAIKKPLVPYIDSQSAFRGSESGPIIIVKYGDFQCSFCSKGFGTIKALEKRYEGKIKYIYKHHPLNFHPQAVIAAKYFEALKLQNLDLAFSFHDELYANQSKVKNGDKYLLRVAENIGADMKRLLKDVKSEKVLKKILKDQEEALKFNIKGTPGFIVNGVPVNGAFPESFFVSIIEKLKSKGIVNI